MSTGFVGIHIYYSLYLQRRNLANNENGPRPKTLRQPNDYY